MQMKHNSNLRLSDQEIAEADALIDAVAADPTIQAIGRVVTRATVLRLALRLGVREMQQRIQNQRSLLEP